MHRRTLSCELEQILRQQQSPEGASLNSLMLQTEGRGLYLVMVLLCLPALTPIPLPVINNLIGLVLMIMAASVVRGGAPRLPRFIGDRKLSTAQWERILNTSVKVLRFLEKFVRPRKTQWLSCRLARVANALIIALLALLLAIPTPPGILFVNSLPSLAIMLIALAQMEEDGWVIWVGYLAAIGAVAYFVFLFKVLVAAAKALAAAVARWWARLM